MFDFLGRWNESDIRKFGLTRMNAELSVVSHRSCGSRLFSKALVVAKIGHDLIDDRHSGQPCRQRNRRSRKYDFVSGSRSDTANVGDKVLGTEIGSNNGRMSEQRPGIRDAQGSFYTGEYAEMRITRSSKRLGDAVDLVRRLDLRHDDTRESLDQPLRDIGLEPFRSDRIDAHEDLGFRPDDLRNDGPNVRASLVLGSRRGRILTIDHDRVRPTRRQPLNEVRTHCGRKKE